MAPTTDTAYDRYAQWRKMLGAGAAFPFGFSQKGDTDLSSDIMHIRHSVMRIFYTPIGTQFMRPEFGCRVHDLVFENNDDILHALIPIYVREAINRWEPRIRYTNVDVQFSETQPNIVVVRIRYEVIRTQVIDNLVFPFYRNLPLSSLREKSGVAA